MADNSSVDTYKKMGWFRLQLRIALDIIDSYDATWGTNHQNIKRRLISYG